MYKASINIFERIYFLNLFKCLKNTKKSAVLGIFINFKLVARVKNNNRFKKRKNIHVVCFSI